MENELNGLIEITGTYERMLFRDEKTGYTLLALKAESRTGKETAYGTITVSARIPIYPIKLPLTFIGRWSETKRGPLFLAEEVLAQAEGERLATGYLITLGLSSRQIQGIVKKIGGNIFSWPFDEKVSEVMKEEVGSSRARTILDQIRGICAQRELFESIVLAGGTPAISDRLFRKYGLKAVDMLAENPYKIGMKNGLSFTVCDNLAGNSGKSTFTKDRLSTAIYCVLEQEKAGGHIYTSQKRTSLLVEKLFAASGTSVPHTLISGSILYADYLHVEENPEGGVYATKYLYEDEQKTAYEILRLVKGAVPDSAYDEKFIENAERECKITYGAEQRNAFQILKNQTGISVLTGGPGTGKTTVIKGLLYAYAIMHPDAKIRLCAPTGRAAQRMTESTGMESVTIHRMLEYRPFEETFVCKNHEDPIDADFLVIDETSMLDISLAALLFGAISSHTKVLLIGDVDQLPAVGAGNVLHDLIASDTVPVFRLTEVKRQIGSSPIVENAIRINQGKTDLVSKSDFTVEYEEEEKVLDKLMHWAKAEYDPKDPFKLQVLVPAHKGVCGVAAINKLLQKEFNPRQGNEDELRYGTKTYRKRDKVILLNNNYEKGYFNGDLGLVTAVEDGYLEINVSGKTIGLSRENLDDVNLAYAMTIHKSQGSEFDTVILVLPQNPKIMLKRNLLYTAVTRAKKVVHILAEPGTIAQSVRTCDTGKRRSKLVERLKGEKISW